MVTWLGFDNNFKLDLKIQIWNFVLKLSYLSRPFTSPVAIHEGPSWSPIGWDLRHDERRRRYIYIAVSHHSSTFTDGLRKTNYIKSIANILVVLTIALLSFEETNNMRWKFIRQKTTEQLPLNHPQQSESALKSFSKS